jgi:hypothetical protein
MGKTVWILGAGFSRALGGPLLGELFSKDLLLKVDAAFDLEKYVGIGPNNRWASAIRDLWGQFEDARRSPPWRDPEDFLDRLDLAAREEGSPSGKWIRKVCRDVGTFDHIKELSLAARHLLAAQCSYFLVGADVKSERWWPYRAWAKRMTNEDAIVTFNYDYVLEMLSDKFSIVHPGAMFHGEDKTRVYKLHGSTNWIRTEGKVDFEGRVIAESVEITTDPFAALSLSHGGMAIGTPGPNKKELTELFEVLWGMAMTELREASTIVFVGFRFPPSDATPRHELLRAIGTRDRPKSQHVSMHTVLGDDVGSPDSRRLAGLIRTALEVQGGRVSDISGAMPGSYSLWQHPLFAEDFLDVGLRADK